MAEFTEVIKQYNRMMHPVTSCRACPLSNICYRTECNHMLVEEPADVEKIVMQWAAKHPEPKPVYPTWEEWQMEMFPGCSSINLIKPCTFMKREDAYPNCWKDPRACVDCAKQQIPPDIAEKLGIKPTIKEN